MANGWGGRRPGSGQKKKTTEEQQTSRRDVVLRTVTVKKWEQAIEAMLAKIIGGGEGDILAFRALAPYVMGAAPKELRVTVDVQERIREAAAAAGIDPSDALAEAERILGQTRP